MGDQPEGTTSTGALVRRAVDGDAAAWDGLLARYSALVWAVVHSYRLPPHDAQDAAQTVWCALAERLSRLRDPERVGAWLAAAAHNECRRQLRTGRRTAPYAPETLDLTDHRSPESVHLAGEGVRAVRRALDGIGLPDRLVAMLYLDYPELGPDRIAEMAGVARAELAAIRRRAFRRLRRLLREQTEPVGRHRVPDRAAQRRDRR
ncbi:RNA polymerase sigma factor [Marinitenerispora sediminis]|uniref:Sigma-70 family RNA polymerase sigma factor n=1 Tax=Marinitenerispora sediminis TaxID=1931232 RepID=A0A368T7B3_9ACTN|nr:sigma-70 family RNA polymerase sigma factor [Marinitenerispora sediminis]RCV50650.1 sigma-70 family RNA polymerase sigma factor [Marinitenerispora sediminis]RCV56208.1 sigma-70 family RNA polymerase sigma factor [Marinitenerispora sediminis]RCV59439.1 sigma-70 family RNA polymerase sigma factor [Marinitenerispora sediminis]